MKITEFYRFANENFLLEARASRMTDSARNTPIISARELFLGMVYSVVFLRRSLLQTEHMLRKPAVKNFFRCTRRIIASDCTYWRVLPHFSLEPIRDYLYVIFVRAKQMGLLAWSHAGKRSLKVGIIDGTCFGKHRAVVFQAIGTSAEVLVDMQRINSRGKELPGAKALLNRLVKNLGKKFVDVVLLDGLYMAQGFIRTCLSSKIDVVIKTSEETLDIIKDAKGLFDQYEDFKDRIEYIEGWDEQRSRCYKIWAACCFKFNGVNQCMKVAQVKEYTIRKDRKSKKEKKIPLETFWVVTTKEDLNAEELRELAHRRWTVENQGFKSLNAVCGSKHTWLEDEHAFEAQILMKFVGFNLLNQYKLKVQDEELIEEFHGVQWTIRLLSELLWESLVHLHGHKICSP